MATGILLNYLDIAAVNALVIWLCKDLTCVLVIPENLVCLFAKIGFALIRPQIERHLIQPGMCLVKTFRAGNLFLEMSGSNVWGIVRVGNTLGKRPWRNVGIPMQDYNFVRVAVMICATRVT